MGCQGQVNLFFSAKVDSVTLALIAHASWKAWKFTGSIFNCRLERQPGIDHTGCMDRSEDAALPDSIVPTIAPCGQTSIIRCLVAASGH